MSNKINIKHHEAQKNKKTLCFNILTQINLNNVSSI